jgi:flagellar basal-body rod modification protein FlgD
MDAIGALSNAGAVSAAAKSETKIAENFDTFLSILTTQLKHQDPLSPMDSTKFTEQLVQFSQVEQAIATNKNLETAIDLIAAGSTANAVSYIGKEVTVEGKVSSLSNGQASWSYTLDGPAVATVLSVRDSAGQIVHSSQGGTALGAHEFVWDGTGFDGQELPSGSYSLEISAINANGEAVSTSTAARGIVTGVNTNDGEPMLLLGQTEVPLAAILTIRQAPTTNETAAQNSVVDTIVDTVVDGATNNEESTL